MNSMPDNPPVRLAVVIVNYGTPHLTVDAVRSILDQTDNTVQVYVVDSASPDSSVAGLTTTFAAQSRVQILRTDKNGGFAYGNNLAIRTACGAAERPDLILLLNPDTIARDSAVQELVHFMQDNPQVGLAGSRLENPDGTSQLAARRFPTVMSELEESFAFRPVSWLLQQWRICLPETDDPHPVDWVPGAALMIRREVFAAIGLLDEAYFLYFEEVDFCFRARAAGFTCWYVPQSRVVHLVGQASGVTAACPGRRPRYWFESRARFWLTHYGILSKLLADTAWSCGRMVFRLRCLLQRRQNPDPPHLLKDFMRFNFGSLAAWRR